jgi:hypothetical protein
MFALSWRIKMKKQKKNPLLFIIRIFTLACAFLLVFTTGFSQIRDQGKGHLIGFIYGQDGVTPIVGAVVKIKNVSTGKVLESTKSDINGVFRTEDIDAGVYTLGVSTPQGDFNLEELIGINSGETTKVSFSLTPYEQDEAAAVHEINRVIYKKEKIEGEVEIGRIIDFDPKAGTAEVFIQKGYIKLNDRIHIRGDLSHFYQDVGDLIFEGQSVEKVFAGNTVTVPMNYAVEEGDLVYLVCKKVTTPFFLTPLGYISALAATGLITYGIVKISEEPCKECSVYLTPPSKNKKK